MNVYKMSNDVLKSQRNVINDYEQQQILQWRCQRRNKRYWVLTYVGNLQGVVRLSFQIPKSQNCLVLVQFYVNEITFLFVTSFKMNLAVTFLAQSLPIGHITWYVGYPWTTDRHSVRSWQIIHIHQLVNV